MDRKAVGWAVMNPEGIDMRTVSDTRRAAIVNWLVAGCGIFITRFHTDSEIERLWREHCGASEATPVTVAPAPMRAV
ncbi:MAG TPA: hypothetical protein VNZ47_11870 [Candidatus Dormibacteraeota bacterium]|jgi:hypothetical protein|nr:hypothetical protein [Candidatus Dormibacteraeota bacterium]